MPTKPGKALFFAVLLWLIGFVWGSIVFMVPSLKATPLIPFVSSNPWISAPILLVWLPVSYLLAKSYLRSVADARGEGLKLGLVFSIVNVTLDLIVLVMLLKVGFGFFASASVLVGYAMLLIVPWWVGRSMQATELK